jgi:hypothetical protein
LDYSMWARIRCSECDRWHRVGVNVKADIVYVD